MLVFETSALDHSATSPLWRFRATVLEGGFALSAFIATLHSDKQSLSATLAYAKTAITDQTPHKVSYFRVGRKYDILLTKASSSNG